MNTTSTIPQSYIDEYAPPSVSSSAITNTPPAMTNTPAPTITSKSSTATVAGTSEALEDQNIFVMLGVNDGTDEEKESFLDELQQVIWEDFLEYDVKLLITAEEASELQKISTAQYSNDLEKQEKIIVYLEKLIPDLEDIMLEKALELKSDLFFERIAGLREYYNGELDKLQILTTAESLAKSDQWSAASTSLNSLSN